MCGRKFREGKGIRVRALTAAGSRRRGWPSRRRRRTSRRRCRGGGGSRAAGRRPPWDLTRARTSYLLAARWNPRTRVSARGGGLASSERAWLGLSAGRRHGRNPRGPGVGGLVYWLYWASIFFLRETACGGCASVLWSKTRRWDERRKEGFGTAS